MSEWSHIIVFMKSLKRNEERMLYTINLLSVRQCFYVQQTFVVLL